MHLINMNPGLDLGDFLWVNHWFDEEAVGMLKGADAVILPQTISRQAYYFIKNLCPRCFPDYDARFMWEGKVGCTMLFWHLGVPHPRTVVFPSVVSLTGDHREMGKPPFHIPPMPFVVKANHGDEGSGTWLIQDRDSFDKVLARLKREEMAGRAGFVIQEYIPEIARDLRVCVIGGHVESYWRYGASEGQGFYCNIAKGGKVVKGIDRDLVRKAEHMVRAVCAQTGINLAGFDLCFRGEAPLFIEINYTFGRTGLGGSEGFYSILKDEVLKWLGTV